MVLIGAISIVRGILLFITQIVAGIVAAYLVKALFQGELAVSTALGGGTTTAQGVIIEMILTGQLVFTIFMLAAEKHQGNFIAPVGIGLSLFIAELVGKSHSTPQEYRSHILEFLIPNSPSHLRRSPTNISPSPQGVFWTGGSLNPARSFGPAVAIHTFKHTQWIYWVGPICGSLFAVLLYKLIKSLEYESANPDPELGPSAGKLANGNGNGNGNGDGNGRVWSPVA